MKVNRLKRKSTERLKSELNGVRLITVTLAIILTVLFTVNVYGLLSKENNVAFIAGSVIGILLCAILPSQFIAIKRIKSELKLRENTN